MLLGGGVGFRPLQPAPGLGSYLVAFYVDVGPGAP